MDILLSKINKKDDKIRATLFQNFAVWNTRSLRFYLTKIISWTWFFTVTYSRKTILKFVCFNFLYKLLLIPIVTNISKANIASIKIAIKLQNRKLAAGNLVVSVVRNWIKTKISGTIFNVKNILIFLFFLYISNSKEIAPRTKPNVAKQVTINILKYHL